jgi:hypothetical protein
VGFIGRSTFVFSPHIQSHSFALHEQAGGLVVLAGTYVIYDRVYYNVPVAGAIAKNRVLKGEGRGSLYNVSMVIQ